MIREFISDSGEVVNGEGSQNNQVKPTRLIIEDASTVSAKILIPQMGTDRKKLAKGEVDVRRFTNITEVDVMWLTWFSNIPKQYGGGYSNDFCESYANWRYSVGGENKKLSVKMVEAISGKKDNETAPKKKGVLERLGLRKGED